MAELKDIASYVFHLLKEIVVEIIAESVVEGANGNNGKGNDGGGSMKSAVKKRIQDAMANDAARVRFWVSALKMAPIKEGMTPKKANRKIMKIQRDYHEEKNRPYKPYEPYSKNAEDRLNNALGIFTQFIEGDEELNDFQMRLASMSRKDFDSFIEVVLEDNLHRWIRFLMQFVDASYKKAKQFAEIITKAILRALNFSFEKLARAEHYDTEDPWEGLMIVLFRGAEVADATATLAFEVVDIANKAVNEGLDSMKRKGGLKGWLAKRLIA